tara:strand:- start:361 stop:765 length:405 start_codon:yes stop_codon:yes gene_type:complete
MVLYQNLAYCRYIFIWSFLFLLNIVPYSPAASLSIIIIINYCFNQAKDIMTKSKFYGMFISELFLLVAILSKVFKFFLLENTVFFVTYSGVIYFYYDINPVYLHSTLLAIDDEKYKNELYFPYMKRVWGYFIFN